MAVNRELNNKVIELYNNLIAQRIVTSKIDFCRKIDYEAPSFAHVLANKRSFPKTKIPVLVTLFGLDKDYFDKITYLGSNDICSKFRFIRKSLELNQREFANKLGISQAAISAIENETNTQPSFNIIWGLINVFKVNPYFIFSDDQVVFDSGKKFSNRSKVDNAISYTKKILEELNKISL